jgi:hypothetical protein
MKAHLIRPNEKTNIMCGSALATKRYRYPTSVTCIQCLRMYQKNRQWFWKLIEQDSQKLQGV